MKCTWMLASTIVGCFGLLASAPAIAQYELPAGQAVYGAQGTPASAGPGAQGTQFTGEWTNGPAPQPSPQGPNGAPIAGEPGGGLEVPPDPSLLVDNGLWDGASSAGPCCAVCGGGSGCPPDWYTLQGVRVLSRSTSRRYPVSFQAPPEGLYSVNQISSAPVIYELTNLDTPTDPSAFNSTRTALIDNPYQVLSTSSPEMGVAAGYNMTIGHYFCRDRNNNDHFVEFTFWGLNSWSDSESVSGYFEPLYSLVDPSLQTPTVTGYTGSLRTLFLTPQEFPGLSLADRTLDDAFNHGLEQSIFYQSTMNNFELNGRFSPRGQPDRLVLHPNGKWRRECQPGRYMSYLYGMRFMQIDEAFRLNSVGESRNQDLVTGSGEYDIVSHNSLLGLQVGAEMTFRRCRWDWGVQAKMGPYVNFSNQISHITAQSSDPDHPDVNRRLSASASQASLIGEVGFQTSYKFRPNLVGRAAWDFMWITGLALAPEQMDFSPNPVGQINRSGTIFSQGASLGLEWLW